jgi:uncharacterized protein (TIGR00266 family)
MPVLAITLEPGESVIAVSGELSWMTESISLTTSTQHGGGGGFLGALKRVAAGGSLFMTEYKAQGAIGMVAFASKIPGHIVPVTVSPTETYMVHRHGFLCGTPGIELTPAFQQSLGAGIFGGEGFVLQKLAGQGEAWIDVGGEIVTYDLVEGQTLRVHPGHVAMFQSSVSFQLTKIQGIRNALFGGDGLFLAALTGPGRIWLQTLTVPNLAHSIAPYLPQKS